MSDLTLSSPDFQNNGKIPSKFTCQGDDINPELNIENIPLETKSLVLILDDPDAPSGSWIHWILFNIPPSTTKIQENSIVGEQGENSWSNRNYNGPCPPSGTHRYVFKLFALDIVLEIFSPDKKKLENAMQERILAKTELTGLYRKI
ncbi:MAG: YbhB/YbcL family Raf kinase inhibitor-like protein [Nanoarchaeota archaeon]|nr:YbhB/YbcL family Raf kinase inhibitor-like protein [Nanoarchaeota archaeon]